MFILQEPQFSNFDTCPYIKDELLRFEYFFATELNRDELEELLNRGWRKFGLYYFRPVCYKCQKCIPIRIRAKNMILTKSLRRVLRKGKDITVVFRPMEFRDEIFEIYRDHSEKRFGKESNLENFISTFYTETCPSLQSEYYLEDQLVAVGFIDKSSRSLSSVYFIYRTAFESYSLGTYSILKETEYAAAQGLDFYYLGYYISENRSMAYKNRFIPNEKYDWQREIWADETGIFQK